MATKRYPFSVRKHAHDIEFYHNFLFNTMREMEDGDIPMDEERYYKIEAMYDGELQELIYALQDNGNGVVAYLTGEQLSLANRIVAWATERRTASCIARGKTEYLQYC